jgi:uncharacterized protein YgbK (DUF1537 family)
MLKDLYDAFTGSTDFLHQVAGACLMAATAIENEAPETQNHVNRMIWMASVRTNPKAMARTMLVAMLENPTLAADVVNATDEAVQWVLNSLVNTFATGV